MVMRLSSFDSRHRRTFDGSAFLIRIGISQHHSELQYSVPFQIIKPLFTLMSLSSNYGSPQVPSSGKKRNGDRIGGIVGDSGFRHFLSGAILVEGESTNFEI